ncbi:myxosortase-dependent M36 family metallopeptidase [Vulgatibacter sp.]|uniref:myxosortase-dependent M36 family metallopeptidase n=1 Tax=Vulgatibacter sp. TaxID=1971226 RepID=UPI0035670019
MKRFAVALASLLAVWSLPGHAAPADAAALPNADALSLVAPARAVNLAALPAGERVLHEERRLGLPTFVWAAFAPQQPAASGSWEQEAFAQVQRHASLYRLDDGDLAGLRLRSLHDTGRGAVVVSFGRDVDEIPIFRDQLRVVFDRKGRLVALSGYVSPEEPVHTGFDLDPTAALAIAAADLGSPSAATDFRAAGTDEAGFALFEAPGLDREARIRPVWFHLPGGLLPAWHLELEIGPAHHAWVIDAVEGAVLYRRNLVQSHAYRVWADPSAGNLPFDGPQGSAGSPHPTAQPDGFQASPTAPARIDLLHGPISTGDPWLPTDAVATTGNNVDAYADFDPPDGKGPDDLRPSTTSAGVFDRIYDVERDPEANDAQSMAAATHLFYVSNWLHDWFYDAGFDEAAGNAQADNYGRGGAAGDRLLAEAQDWSGYNNASMGTPADGGRPRMQMHRFAANFQRWLQVTAPESAAAYYGVGLAAFGPQVFDVSGPLVVMDDGNGDTTDGCETPTGDLTGAIVYVDRGICPFSEKARRVEDAGGIGIVIGNNEDGGAPGMSGEEEWITIPVVSVSQNDGNTLRGSSGLTVRLFREKAIDRDSALDTSVVAHEFTHMVSSRLIGDAAGLGNNQGGSMGEGWSDFAALLFLVREEDAQVASNAAFGGTYAIGTWVSSGGGNRGYYYGMRRYPYSVDFGKNPLTFGLIENDVQLPSTAPYAWGRSGRWNAEVHRSGEVWATMLWECYVALLRDGSLAFPEARQRMLELLVASLKITPSDPTFLEARDAMLAAAWASDPAEYALFLEAFARRGAGLRAVAPERWSHDHAGVVESFEAGYDVGLVSARIDDAQAGCDADGILDAGEAGQLVLVLRNDGIGALESATVTVTSPTAGLQLGGTVQLPALQPLQTTEIAVPISLDTATEALLLDLEIVVDDPRLEAPRTFAWGTWGHFDERPAASSEDSMEGARDVWRTAGDASLADAPWRRIYVAGAGWRWLGPTVGLRADQSLVTPTLLASDEVPLRLHFRHRFAFEEREGAADGAVVEISTDGMTWEPVAAGYNGSLDNRSSNPLAGREAFVGRSAGWPALEEVSVDLGTAYAGEAVRIRFRVGSDAAIGGHGWEVDDVRLEGIANLPFPAPTPESGNCENSAPVAVIVAPAAIDERNQTLIEGGGSYDVDWDPLTWRWSQLQGPAVTWVDMTSPVARFFAPEVLEDEPIVLQLEVSDGTLVDSTTATLMVRQVNRVPQATVVAPAEVAVGEVAVLDGSASADADGDPITFRWTQVAGRLVELDDETAPAPRFTAPMVLGSLHFTLVVSDGEAESEAADVVVAVVPENRPPTAVAGPAITGDERSRVQLVEGGGTDPDGDELGWQWSQVSGTEALIEDPSAQEPFVLLPDVDGDEVLVFALVATDGRLESEPALVEVHVREVNRAPVVVTLPHLDAVLGRDVVIDAAASEDPDGEPITFAFRQLEGPHVDLEILEGGRARFRAPSDPALLLFEVTASDPRGGVGAADVSVRVAETPVKPSGCGCSGAGPSAAVQLAGWAVVAAALRRKRR